MKTNISIKEAAKLMGKSQQFIRVGLQRNILPFRIAEKLPNSTRYTYYINPSKFYSYIGKSMRKCLYRKKTNSNVDYEGGRKSEITKWLWLNVKTLGEQKKTISSKGNKTDMMMKENKSLKL